MVCTLFIGLVTNFNGIVLYIVQWLLKWETLTTLCIDIFWCTRNHSTLTWETEIRFWTHRSYKWKAEPWNCLHVHICPVILVVCIRVPFRIIQGTRDRTNNSTGGSYMNRSHWNSSDVWCIWMYSDSDLNVEQVTWYNGLLLRFIELIHLVLGQQTLYYTLTCISRHTWRNYRHIIPENNIEILEFYTHFIFAFIISTQNISMDTAHKYWISISMRVHAIVLYDLYFCQ